MPPYQATFLSVLLREVPPLHTHQCHPAKSWVNFSSSLSSLRFCLFNSKSGSLSVIHHRYFKRDTEFTDVQPEDCGFFQRWWIWVPLCPPCRENSPVISPGLAEAYSCTGWARPRPLRTTVLTAGLTEPWVNTGSTTEPKIHPAEVPRGSLRGLWIATWLG